MRETIAIIICIIIFIVALQTGLIRTGLDYEAVKNSNLNLKTTNERITEELKKYKSGKRGEEKDDTYIKKMEETVSELEQTLNKYIDNGDAEVAMKKNVPVIKIYEKALFERNKAELNADGKNILLRVSSTFSKFPDHEIAVTGYTNTGRIIKPWSSYASTHRELSTYKANIIVAWLGSKADVEAVRLVSSGYGYVRPTVNNNSATNRRKNQYVEITIREVSINELENARVILGTEKLPDYKRKVVDVPKTVKKEKSTKEYEESLSETEMKEEVIGEDALDSFDEENFETGYEMPDQDQGE